MFKPESVSVPAPDLVKLMALTPSPKMPPSVLLAELVNESKPLKLILLGAVSVPVLIVTLPSGALAPIAPLKVVVPVPLLIVSALPAPSSVP